MCDVGADCWLPIARYTYSIALVVRRTVTPLLCRMTYPHCRQQNSAAVAQTYVKRCSSFGHVLGARVYSRRQRLLEIVPRSYFVMFFESFACTSTVSSSLVGSCLVYHVIHNCKCKQYILFVSVVRRFRLNRCCSCQHCPPAFRRQIQAMAVQNAFVCAILHLTCGRRVLYTCITRDVVRNLVDQGFVYGTASPFH